MPKRVKSNIPLNLGEETIGQRLSRLRKEKGLSQRELAKKMGLTQSIISAYELDTRTLSAKMLAQFAIFFGVTTDELIGLKSNGKEKIRLNLRLMKRIHKIERLSEYNQKIILRMIDSYLRDNLPKE
jgi:transcriptional regulator with XRE-family HTH domain